MTPYRSDLRASEEPGALAVVDDDARGRVESWALAIVLLVGGAATAVGAALDDACHAGAVLGTFLALLALATLFALLRFDSRT